jgi:flagellar operon protein (TIGR03826 family)
MGKRIRHYFFGDASLVRIHYFLGDAYSILGGKFMLQVEHCPRCNQLFQKVSRDVCPACIKELEQKYELIYKFVRKRENREATIEDIEKNSKVAKEDIIRIIRSGRLNIQAFPNLGYPCETDKCEALVRKGRLCQKCLDDINNGLEIEQRKKNKEQQLNAEEKKKYRTYATFD